MHSMNKVKLISKFKLALSLVLIYYMKNSRKFIVTIPVRNP